MSERHIQTQNKTKKRAVTRLWIKSHVYARGFFSYFIHAVHGIAFNEIDRERIVLTKRNSEAESIANILLTYRNVYPVRIVIYTRFMYATRHTHGIYKQHTFAHTVVYTFIHSFVVLHLVSISSTTRAIMVCTYYMYKYIYIYRWKCDVCSNVPVFCLQVNMV